MDSVRGDGMKAVIELDVPEWQIGQEVTVYFPDTMQKRAVCEKKPEAIQPEIDKLLRNKQRHIDKLQAECSELKHKFLEKTRIVRCRDCKYWHNHGITTTCDRNAGNDFPSDWFCADGERMANNG